MATVEKEKGKPSGVGQDKPFDIDVTYNGIVKKLEISNAELISSVLQKAISVFGITSNQHLLSLFDQEGRELPGDESVKDAKVKKKEALLLRQSAVKAG